MENKKGLARPVPFPVVSQDYAVVISYKARSGARNGAEYEGCGYALRHNFGTF